MSFVTGLEKVMPIIEQYAPTVASALGCPWGGAVLAMIEHTFGVPSGATQTLSEALQSDPSAKTKLSEIEATEAVKSLHVVSVDRQGARDYDIELAKLGRTDWMKPLLAMLLFVGIGTIVYIMAVYEIDKISTTLTFLVTLMIREIPDIYKSYFGGDVENGK